MLIALVVLAALASPAVQIVGPNQIAGAAEPQAAVDASGHIFVTFGAANKIYVSQSDDKGATFDSPVKAADAPSLMLGHRRGPRISTSNGNVVISAVSEGNLLCWTWKSGAQLWSTAPAQVNDEAGSADEGLHAMTANANIVVCTWLDHRNKSTELFASVSEDSGETWSPNTLVYKSPGGNICECCHPSVTIGADDTIHIMFRNSLNENRDMYVTDSSDEGQTWTEPKLMGKGHWKLDVCPMDGGAITGDTDGAVSTLWQRDGAVFFAHPDAAEKKIGVGLQPWIFGSYGLYLKKAGGPLMSFQGGGEPRLVTGDAIDPMVAGQSGGAGPIVATWATSKGAIMAQVLAR